MGWLYRRTLDGYATPRAYLDAQFTYERKTYSNKVLRSALIQRRTYYAAVEHTVLDTGEREVWAIVCLVDYKPRALDRYIFGFKDMDETMGPYETDCPEVILDLLTPTQCANAIHWRQNCRATATRHRETAGASQDTGYQSNQNFRL